jgi:D-sedoheptulose 7-phosphate isomerase
MANFESGNRWQAEIDREIQENITVTTELRHACSSQITEAATLILNCFKTGGKLLAFGNGGSAAQAQHLVAELVGRYRSDRQPLPAFALTTDSASMTSIGNDYGFEQIFSRQLQALAKPGDIVVAISTSGNSPNVLNALTFAQKLHLPTIGLTGKEGGKMSALVDTCLHAPSDSTPRTQEMHTLMIHLLCGLVENAFLQQLLPEEQPKSTGKVK